MTTPAHVCSSQQYNFYSDGQTYEFKAIVHRDAKGKLISLELEKNLLNLSSMAALKDFIVKLLE